MNKQTKINFIQAIADGVLLPSEIEVKNIILTIPDGSQNDTALAALTKQTDELNERRAAYGLPLDRIVVIIEEQD